MESTKREIKFSKTSCYFCDAWLENNNFKDHIESCGQVLEECPNNCLLNVKRNELNAHLLNCPKNNSSTFERRSTIKNKELEIQNQLARIEEETASLRLMLNEEIDQRLQILTDLGSIKKHNQIFDEWIAKVSDVLNIINKRLNEETESRCIDMAKCRDDIKHVASSVSELEDWRVEMSMKVEEIRNNIILQENVTEKLENSIDRIIVSTGKASKMISELSVFKTVVIKAVDDQNIELNSLNERLKTLDSVLLGQNNSIQIVNSDLTSRIDSILVQCDKTIQMIEDISNKHSKLDVEIKSMKHIIHENEDKCDKMEKLVAEYRIATSDVKQGIDNLNTHLWYEDKLNAIHNVRGHLIWRVDKYAEKLKDAKENDTVLHSPVFCNRQYGYTLRLDVNLNGIGTWRGRNLNACLTVVNGFYDSLLPWPCKLEADIILRDQPNDLKESQNFYKTIVVKKQNEEVQIKPSQYIHIPHKTIDSFHFIRNDSIFLEVRVHSSSKSTPR